MFILASSLNNHLIETWPVVNRILGFVIRTREIISIISKVVVRDGVAIEVRVCKEFCGVSEVDDGEVLFAVSFVDACASSDDLLELCQGVDRLIEHDNFTGLGIDTRGQQF